MGDALVQALAIPLGLVVGSVLTMVVDRVPDGIGVFAGGPRCPHCEAPIAGRDLVPVLSWVRLRGRCRSCAHRLTVAYPIVELLTAGAFFAAALRFGAHPVLVPFLVLFAALVALSVVDFFLFLLPDRIIFPTLAVSVVLIAAVSVYLDRPDAIGRALAGSAVYGLALLVPWLVNPNAIGFGDVKLALVMGLFLGWLPANVIGGVQLILYALLLGCLLGVGVGLTLVVVKRRTGRDLLPDPEAEGAEADEARISNTAFPFGPALALGTVVAVLFSHSLLGA